MLVLSLALARLYATDFTSSAASPGYRLESVGSLGSSLVDAHPHVLPSLRRSRYLLTVHGNEDCLQEEFSADQDKGAAYSPTLSDPLFPLSVDFTVVL